tara:strand:- start:363 stop:620 length:258 start_codon:yes stop_codon:yes gene_type:complete
VKKIKENVSKVTNKISSGKLPNHKHCRICGISISPSTDPRVCKDQECIDQHEKNTKNEKQMRIWMFIFFGIFAFIFLSSILRQLV